MKKIEWRDGNHMKIETGHKTFDRQADLVTTGNVVGHVQYSGYVRAATELECNRMKFEKGHLRAFDLQWWIKTLQIPTHVLEYVMEATEEKSVILYEFHHHKQPHGRVTHGYAVTTPDHYLLARFVTGRGKKSLGVMQTVLPYIVESQVVA